MKVCGQGHVRPNGVRKCAPCRNTRARARYAERQVEDVELACSVECCSRRATARSLCGAHYDRKRRGLGNWSDPIRERCGHWLNRAGYVVLYRPEHPNASAAGAVLQHVAVMTEHLGRPLHSHENVHHKNGSRTDNRISNLELWSTSQPPGQRVADKVEWAKEILALYGEGVAI